MLNNLFSILLYLLKPDISKCCCDYYMIFTRVDHKRGTSNSQIVLTFTPKKLWKSEFD